MNKKYGRKVEEFSDVTVIEIIRKFRKFVIKNNYTMPIEKINRENVTSPALSEDEKIHYQLQKVALQFNKETEEGMGTLFVTTK